MDTFDGGPDLMLAEPLTNDDLEIIMRLLVGLNKWRELTEKINRMASEAGLPLRQIPDFHGGLMSNDISQVLFSHKLQVERVREEAMARLGGVAA